MIMMNLEQAIKTTKPVCALSIEAAKKQWDNILKPLNSLGNLETVVSRIAGIQRSKNVDISKRAVAVMCADNGVVAQGVAQSDSSITAILAENFTKGTTTVCTMAKYIGVDVVPVDIGINNKLDTSGILDCAVMRGTNDITSGAAMSREQAIKAIEVGINIAVNLKERGYKLIATGEMGIGNTTTSSAIASVILDQPIEKVTGRGAGLNNEGLERKIAAIKKAIEVNNPDKNDVIDVLCKVGGLDIAGMTGLYIGGAAVNLPVMLDGFISGISAIIASKISPLCKDYMIPSHVSAEPAGKMILDELGFSPIVTAGMCLGEGTGAMAALGVIDMAVHVYHNAITFQKIEVKEYEHYEVDSKC